MVEFQGSTICSTSLIQSFPFADYELTRSKPARQSNTYNSYAASLALDGNPASSSVSAVDAQSSVIGWWQVDLGDIYKINKLTLVNSDDFYGKLN